MKIKNLESDRKQRIETLRETIRGCEREIRRLEENPDTCEEGITRRSRICVAGTRGV